MKYIIIILIILISSCNIFVPDDNYDWQIPVEINTKQEALDYVSAYNYEMKNGVFTPEQFYNKGYGDCEEFSLMLQYIFITQLGLKADLIIGGYNSDILNHAWVELDGIIYESVRGVLIINTDFYNPLYKYSYPESVCMVDYYGGFISDNKYRY